MAKTFSRTLSTLALLALATPASAYEAVQVFRHIDGAVPTCPAGGGDGVVKFTDASGRSMSLPVSAAFCADLQISQQFPVEVFVRDGRVIGVGMVNDDHLDFGSGLLWFDMLEGK